MTVEQLGRARQVRVTADRTAIIDGAGSAEQMAFRVAQPRAELERATFGVDEDVLTERIGSLSGRVAVIKVGAPTNAELASCSTGSRTRCPRPGQPWQRGSLPEAERR